ncbi:MAG: hypothetical protein JO347_09870 [Candidatus Eremiobacteraeota bacterium]|nr:hypothetical protein [Candidatus Eremiobacteraeota bacterium]
MERKQFLVAGIAGAAAVAAGIATAASDTSNSSSLSSGGPCGPHPVALASGASPRPHVPHARPSSVDEALRHVERILEALGKDPNDYGGNKSKAIASLQEAQSELTAAVAYEKANPNPNPTSLTL